MKTQRMSAAHLGGAYSAVPDDFGCEAAHQCFPLVSRPPKLGHLLAMADHEDCGAILGGCKQAATGRPCAIEASPQDLRSTTLAGIAYRLSSSACLISPRLGCVFVEP